MPEYEKMRGKCPRDYTLEEMFLSIKEYHNNLFNKE